MKFLLKFFFCLLPALFLFSNSGKAQTVIEGRVTNQENNEPVAGANVYLSGTTIGSTTNINGEYSFQTSKNGVYKLIFSFVGFDTHVIEIRINSQDTLSYDVELAPNVTELDEIVISSSNRDWQRDYNQFEREFLGQTSNADKTEIVNSYVLNFSSNASTGQLIAEAEQPLTIRNEALGYIIYAELDDFRWTNSGEGFYRIYPRFEEMESDSRREQRNWEQNRRSTYLGSLQHFLRSLYNGNVNSNGFSLQGTVGIIPLTQGEVRYELRARPDVSPQLRQVLKGFKIQSRLRISHGELGEYRTKRFGGTPFGATISHISPNTENGFFFIDNFGNLLDPNSLKIEGDWAKNRVANQLPLDYSLN